MEYHVALKVNGEPYRTHVPAGMTLLQMLRERLHYTGTKEGCGIGECGACSLLMNGVLVNACLVLAVEADGAELQTIEGEANGDELSDLQQAFVRHHALQCGFCTPGMLMAARDLLRRNPTPAHDEIVEAIAGNLCRCTGYETVVDAIREVVGASAKEGGR